MSPGASKAERGPTATTSTLRPAWPLPIPKNLVIDMVDDLAPTEATGRGRRIHKTQKVFGEDAAPSKGKRKRADFDEATSTSAPTPSKKRATTLDDFFVSAAPSVSTAAVQPLKRTARAASRPASSSAPPPPPPPAKNKRKRAVDDDEVVATAPPPTKRRATSRVASKSPLCTTPPPPHTALAIPPFAPGLSTPLFSPSTQSPTSHAPAPILTAQEASRAASTAPLPGMKRCATSRAGSAAPPHITNRLSTPSTPSRPHTTFAIPPVAPGCSTPLFSPSTQSPTPYAPAPIVTSPEHKKRGQSRKAHSLAAAAPAGESIKGSVEKFETSPVVEGRGKETEAKGKGERKWPWTRWRRGRETGRRSSGKYDHD